MTRPDDSWKNLNGLWEFEPGAQNQPPPFGKNLSSNILVPFPVESCLSGVGTNYKYLWYRLVFNKPSQFTSSRVLLHFGAVDWQTTVYLNRNNLGSHTGGYDGFSFDVTSSLKSTDNELIVFVYDPSDEGFQPNGKQRISAIHSPGGDTYTPSSGIWQTVWLENVPEVYIADNKILADTKKVTITTTAAPQSQRVPVTYDVLDGNNVVASGSGISGSPVTITIPSPKLWDVNSPFLYNLRIKTSNDSVLSYFGMREVNLVLTQHPGVPDTGVQQGIDRPGSDLPGYPVELPSADPTLCWNMCKQKAGCDTWAYAVPGCDSFTKPMCWLKSGYPGTNSNKCRASGSLARSPYLMARPHLNGKFLFLAGWLDQSWWPDGQYTAPTDEALAFDIQAVKTFGLNSIRLHQKVNPERWYYHADRTGVIVMQDMIQKYGGATAATVQPFIQDLRAMISGRYNHPCIIQWDVFNEGDCVSSFNATSVVELVQSLDPSRFVDTNSGGPANNLHIADVNDIHSYPWPGHPIPSKTQFAMIGEFGGIGAFIDGHMWVPNQCETYLHVNTPQDEADTYVKMASMILQTKDDISVSIYTQITDVERECDGFLNYDRTNKFTDEQTKQIANANYELINN
eukprot:TRINITY_DN6295_c0_g1_i1.p1 TRINITY_DN6295_c0_g1~~TRINITY_DN6295_c0_g1_i1.p1  ORF type:complete len:699 (-),score=142.08 TRINITY_DN6295_c0_g1_i1:105-1982(-)